MNKKEIKKIKSQEGITLFVTLVLMGVLLGVSASLLNITLKQYQLAGVSYASEVAFQAANAGMECALFYDWTDNSFDVPGDGTTDSSLITINCMDDSYDIGSRRSGIPQTFNFEWGNGASTVCTEISVFKYYEDPSSDGDSIGPDVEVEGDFAKVCPEGSECTVIQSRGYNVGCGLLTSGARVVEREYTQVY